MKIYLFNKKKKQTHYMDFIDDFLLFQLMT